MNNAIPFIALAGLVMLALVMKGRRRKPATTFDRVRMGIEGALDDAEHRTHELRARAKKMRGDAKKRIEAQAHEVEERQKELRVRLDELKGEAGKLLERARS
jgi:TolA-binding protein